MDTLGHLTSLASTDLDGRYVNQGGGTMTGLLTLAANGLKVGTNQLVISSGNVGIGTTVPESALHVASTGFRTIYARNLGTSLRTYAVWGESAGTNGRGVFGDATASSGTTFGVRGHSASISGRGVYGHATASSGGTDGVRGESVSTNGRGVHGLATASSGTTYGVRGVAFSPNGFGVFCDGDFGGTGAKHFIQPHPTDASKEIRFVSLEGNESGTYFRGSTNLTSGRAVIEVPEEFRLVTESERLTVQLTSKGPALLWYESKDLERIVIRGDRDVEFDYFVNGVRRGFADLKLIRENHAYVPEVRGIPYGTQYREGHRRVLVENGILNPDFTPNEQKAVEMGWTLRDPTSEELSRHEAARLADGGTR